MIVPCVTFGQNAEAAGVTSCVMGGLAMFVPLLNLYCLIKVRGEHQSNNAALFLSESEKTGRRSPVSIKKATVLAVITDNCVLYL